MGKRKLVALLEPPQKKPGFDPKRREKIGVS
jgi:hypothetical protein